MDLPALRLVVTEHRGEILTGSVCQQHTVGHVPKEIQAPAHSGSRVRRLAVSVSPYPLLPMERIGEIFPDLLSCAFSEGTLANGRQEAARTLAPTMPVLTSLLVVQKLDHVDETGARVKGRLHGFHVNATRWLTLSHGHRQRGQQARDAIGMFPASTGRAMHDRSISSDHDAGAQRVWSAPVTRWFAHRRTGPAPVGAG